MKKILIFMFGIFCFTSCMEEDPETYAVDTLTDVATDNEFMAIDGSATNFSFDGTNLSGVQNLDVLVAMAAAPKSSGVNYAYSTTSGTAMEGVHFSSTGSSGTIPAGNLKASVPMTVDLDQMEIGEIYNFTIQLTSSDLPNFDSNPKTISISKVCASTLAGEYSGVATGESTDSCCPGVVTAMGPVTLTDLGAGAYTISDWTANLYQTWYEVYGINQAYVDGGGMNAEISDVCGEISGAFNEPFGTATTLTGSVDAATGVITFSWVTGYNDTAEVVLTPM